MFNYIRFSFQKIHTGYGHFIIQVLKRKLTNIFLKSSEKIYSVISEIITSNIVSNSIKAILIYYVAESFTEFNIVSLELCELT